VWAHAIDIDKVQDAFGDGVNGDGLEFVGNGDREGVECNGSAVSGCRFRQSMRRIQLRKGGENGSAV
jgi:hypothetical protein